MIHDPQHTLTHVSAEPPATVQLVFADGATFRLVLATTIRTHTALAALADPEMFSKARLDTLGGYVIWIDDDLEMAADNLRHLAVEQAGGIRHERLIKWVYRHHMTQVQAAEAIGILIWVIFMDASAFWAPGRCASRSGTVQKSPRVPACFGSWRYSCLMAFPALRCRVSGHVFSKMPSISFSQ